MPEAGIANITDLDTGEVCIDSKC
nr:hypothetical protein [Acinetobacter baumannii]